MYIYDRLRDGTQQWFMPETGRVTQRKNGQTKRAKKDANGNYRYEDEFYAMIGKSKTPSA